ncbi:MAG: hypothetical protein LBI56_01610 [Puniceicoccales bacterium]|nr:hypothetical protein [Puniceicoccales bacterium]
MKRKNEIVSHFSKSSLDAVYCYKKNYSYEASQEMEYIRREYCRRKCSKLAEIGASMTDVVASKFDMYVIMEKRYFSSPCESGSNSSNSNNNVGVNFLNNANAYNVVYEIGLPPTVSPQAHFMRVFPQNNPGILNEKLKNLLKETCDRDLNVMSFRSDVIADIGCAFGINAEMITVGEFIHELRKRACAPIASFRCSMEIEGEDNASGNAFDVGNKSTSGAEVVYVQIGISVPDNMK